MLLEIPDANHIQTPTRKSCPLAPHNLPRAFSRARTHTFFNLSRSLSALSLPTRSKSTNLCSDNLIALATMSHFDGAKDTLGQAKGFAQDKTDASIGEAQVLRHLSLERILHVCDWSIEVSWLEIASQTSGGKHYHVDSMLHWDSILHSCMISWQWHDLFVLLLLMFFWCVMLTIK